MNPVYDRWGVTVYHGDCLDVMRELPDASVDSVVTDPPYGLEFMGAEWDSFKPGGKRPLFGDADGSPFRRNAGTPSWAGSGNPLCANCGGTKYDRTRPNGCRCEAPRFPNEAVPHMRAYQLWCQQWAAECLRVLKPGGWLLAFGGTRTHHRLACGIEDAGFELRDTITWIYGQGFPKSRDVSKDIDRMAGAEREVLGTRVYGDGHIQRSSLDKLAPPIGPFERTQDVRLETAPATDAARQWSGWGTGLKPAHEPIIVARKPLSGTVASTVLQHGTGALNIAACCVPHGGDVDLRQVQRQQQGEDNGWRLAKTMAGTEVPMYKPGGRWPPNLLLTHAARCEVDGCDREWCPVAELDAQSGHLKSGLYKPEHADHGKTAGTYGAMSGRQRAAATYGDSGGASRFFPVFRWEEKAPPAERPVVNGVAHPTVKPLDLMRWLVRLVTQPGGLVLDCFAGSGTTGQAARAEGMRVILIEQDEEYLPHIQARLEGHSRTGKPSAAASPSAEAPLSLFDLFDGGDAA